MILKDNDINNSNILYSGRRQAMKPNKVFLPGIVMLLSISLYMLAATCTAEAQELGAILVAHGSTNSDWNDQIENFYEKIESDMPPSQLAFLRFDNEKTLANAVNNLKKDGITKIVIIHLSPSSFSIRHDEIVNFAKDTMEANPSLQLTVSPAMDVHPLFVGILKDYTKELSPAPGNDSLILLADGPADELDNIIWVRKLDRIGKMLRAQLRLREVVSMTLRNYSADLIHEQAIIDLKKTAKRVSEKGRVIVVPCVLSESSFHQDLKLYLKGIVPQEDICMKGVLDHPNAEKWVQKVMRKGINQPSVRPVNRNWTAHDAEIGGEFKYEYGRAKIIEKPRGQTSNK
jgi:sirohydrochlorin ferrochelatase